MPSSRASSRLAVLEHGGLMVSFGSFVSYFPPTQNHMQEPPRAFSMSGVDLDQADSLLLLVRGSKVHGAQDPTADAFVHSGQDLGMGVGIIELDHLRAVLET